MKTIQELTQKMQALVDEKGWSRAGSAKVQSPKNLAISLVLESAEVLEHFQWQEDVKDKSALSLELADVMLYLLQLAAITDIDLEAAVERKLEINHSRQWESPQ